jgi:hypothetical protein
MLHGSHLNRHSMEQDYTQTQTRPTEGETKRRYNAYNYHHLYISQLRVIMIHEEHSKSQRNRWCGSIDFIQTLLVCVVKLLFTPPKVSSGQRESQLAVEN